jgi:hypothetical protein
MAATKLSDPWPWSSSCSRGQLDATTAVAASRTTPPHRDAATGSRPPVPRCGDRGRGRRVHRTPSSWSGPASSPPRTVVLAVAASVLPRAVVVATSALPHANVVAVATSVPPRAAVVAASALLHADVVLVAGECVARRRPDCGHERLTSRRGRSCRRRGCDGAVVALRRRRGGGAAAEVRRREEVTARGHGELVGPSSRRTRPGSPATADSGVSREP